MPQFIINPEKYDLPKDLVAIGGQLNTPTLISAYQKGIFPWPEDDNTPLLWYSPNPRGILSYRQLHISRSLRRPIKQQKFEIRIDTAFEQTIHHCQSVPRLDQGGTWITPKMKQAYIQLHRDNIAHSIETYFEDKLVGGLYGIYVSNTFSGESMFHLMPNASKVALVALLQILNANTIEWIDTQMLTPVVESLGGELITRNGYLQLLEANQINDEVPWTQIKKTILTELGHL